jgi:hypothetical protein
MEINYIIQKSRRRSMSIQVADDRKIIVKVPLGTPTFSRITSDVTNGSSKTAVYILRE